MALLHDKSPPVTAGFSYGGFLPQMGGRQEWGYINIRTPQ